jgi:hypothetical protein
MSAYANYVKDFPTRCIELLDLTLHAEKKGLDVTLLLAVAGQAVMMPLERLELLRSTLSAQRTDGNHPSGDAKTFKSAADKLSEALDKQCKVSSLFQNDHKEFDPDSWKYNECELGGVNLENVEPMKSIADKSCRTILKILRNALAHGNLRTDGKPINRLIFLSRVSKDVEKYHRLECHPDELRRFLKAWANALRSLKLDPDKFIDWPLPPSFLEAVA